MLKVLSDWRGSKKKHAELTEDAKNAMEARMIELERTKATGANTSKKKTLKQEKQSNQEDALAMDMGLKQSTQLKGLSSFRATQPVKQLVLSRRASS